MNNKHTVIKKSVKHLYKMLHNMIKSAFDLRLKMLIKVVIFAFYLIFDQIQCEECDTLPNLEVLDKCCDSPNLIVEEYAKSCEADDSIDNIWTWSECYFKNAGGIVDGKPNAMELKKKAKPILVKFPEWESIFNTAVDKCLPEVIAKDVETQKRASEPPFNFKNINTLYAHLIECIDVELLLKCPASNRQDGPNCSAAIGYVQKCSKDFPPRYILLEEYDKFEDKA